MPPDHGRRCHEQRVVGAEPRGLPYFQALVLIQLVQEQLGTLHRGVRYIEEVGRPEQRDGGLVVNLGNSPSVQALGNDLKRRGLDGRLKGESVLTPSGIVRQYAAKVSRPTGQHDLMEVKLFRSTRNGNIAQGLGLVHLPQLRGKLQCVQPVKVVKLGTVFVAVFTSHKQVLHLVSRCQHGMSRRLHGQKGRMWRIFSGVGRRST
mmetsp:Transcript_26337/g.61569  ORF Transcript_26337/g.61569 Transcript_26337/m.61569 type:complete len:205 (-) Transcript_26337:425-1039(-)